MEYLYVNNLVCKDVCGIIGDYLSGDKHYWKSKYNNVLMSLAKRRDEFMTVTLSPEQLQVIGNIQYDFDDRMRKAHKLCYRGLIIKSININTNEEVVIFNWDLKYNLFNELGYDIFN